MSFARPRCAVVASMYITVTEPRLFAHESLFAERCCATCTPAGQVATYCEVGNVLATLSGTVGTVPDRFVHVPSISCRVLTVWPCTLGGGAVPCVVVMSDVKQALAVLTRAVHPDTASVALDPELVQQFLSIRAELLAAHKVASLDVPEPAQKRSARQNFASPSTPPPAQEAQQQRAEAPKEQPADQAPTVRDTPLVPVVRQVAVVQDRPLAPGEVAYRHFDPLTQARRCRVDVLV